jgi:predicted NBD/HSP70 family sugar kinase
MASTSQQTVLKSEENSSTKTINPLQKTVNPVRVKYYFRAAAKDNKSSDYIYKDRDTCRRIQIKWLKHVKQMLDPVQKMTAPLWVYVLGGAQSNFRNCTADLR